MRRLSKWLVRLYPASWRKRYGSEFEAMLDEVPADWRSSLDLFVGAIQMQFSVRAVSRLVLTLSLTGLVIGFGASYLATPRYVSTATLLYEAPVGNLTSQELNRQLYEATARAQGSILARVSLANFIQHPNIRLYASEITRMPLEDVIETMRSRDIRIQLAPNPGAASALTISFTNSVPAKTQLATEKLASMFVEEVNRRQVAVQRVGVDPLVRELNELEARVAALERRAGSASSAAAVFPSAQTTEPQLRILDHANLPISPVFPNRAAFAATGFAAGLGLALLLAVIFRARFRPIDPLPVSLR